MVETGATTSPDSNSGAPATRRCGSCVLWRVASNDQTGMTGRCFRFPPTSPNGERSYPITARTDWCGGHISAGEDKRGFRKI